MVHIPCATADASGTECFQVRYCARAAPGGGGGGGGHGGILHRLMPHAILRHNSTVDIRWPTFPASTVAQREHQAESPSKQVVQRRLMGLAQFDAVCNRVEWQHGGLQTADEPFLTYITATALGTQLSSEQALQGRKSMPWKKSWHSSMIRPD